MKQNLRTTIFEIGVKNQMLVSKCIDLSLFQEAKKLMEIDDLLKLLIKDEHPTTHYIWRTQGDEKVRSSHAANNGKVFSWDNPPATGHPGEEYGCRCWAEPYEINDPPLEDVYPEILLLPLLRVGRSALSLGARLLRSPKTEKPNNFTEHGGFRSLQRNISSKEVQKAIETAKRTGNISTKLGKYGTPQTHYKGSNGITVIEETAGRNAGKIITFWRNK